MRQTACLLITLAVAGVSGVSASPAAAANGWSRPTRIFSIPGVKDTRVACPTVKFCLAVSERYSTGATGDAYSAIFNGKHWSRPVRFTSDFTLYGMSCGSAGFCVAVGNYYSSPYSPAAVFWRGSWGRPETLPFQPAGSNLDDISCPGPGICVAAGTDSPSTYRDGKWSSSSGPSVDELSCPTANFCAGILEPYAYTLSAGVWRGPKAINHDANSQEVSCASPSFCMAVGSEYATMYHDGAWGRSHTLTRGCSNSSGCTTSVSCPSVSFCMAVGGGNGAAYLYQRGHWAQPVVVDKFQDVSCPASGFCVAVDEEGRALIYRG